MKRWKSRHPGSSPTAGYKCRNQLTGVNLMLCPLVAAEGSVRPIAVMSTVGLHRSLGTTAISARSVASQFPSLSLGTQSVRMAGYSVFETVQYHTRHRLGMQHLASTGRQVPMHWAVLGQPRQCSLVSREVSDHPAVSSTKLHTSNL